MTAPLLEIRDLDVSFPLERSPLARLARAPARVDVLCGVSLEVARGETLAIVGESGSGKSTLARSLVGLVRPRSGSIRLDGIELLESRAVLRRARRRMAMTFQDPIGSLSPRLPVRSLLFEALQLAGVARGKRAAHARELLELVGLRAELLERFPHELSGGQARRVGVARALALGPDLLLADEPTSGLDVSVQGEILNLLVSVQQKLGLTLVLISHDLLVVRHVSDRVAVLYLGRVVEEGPVEEVLARPRHPYTRALVLSALVPDPEQPARSPQLIGEVPSLLRRPAGCELHGRCPIAEERCRHEPPGFVDDDGHGVRCHFPLESRAPDR